MNPAKKIISNVIFAGALGAALFFGLSFLFAPQWLISAKVVVFPAGSPTVEKYLAQEIGNTAEIIRSSSFQEKNFQNYRQNLLDVRQIENSSTIAVEFLVKENEITAIEDRAVLIPDGISEYARDLYGGSPFEYKLLSDPEISTKAVRPDLIRNVLWGFGMGALAYLLYWLMFASFFEARRREVNQIYFPAAAVSAFRDSFAISPDLRPIEEKMQDRRDEKESMLRESEKEIAEHAATEESGIFAEMFPPEKIIEKKEELPVSAPAMKTAAAPPNLPIAEQAHVTVLPQGEEPAEPTDEQVKDRLNKLMRGEL